jgi:hypothetical protein
MHVAVFLDTMVYMHYKPVDDIDWPALLSADSVELRLPRITIQELDEHKNTHANSKIRDRVRRLLDRLEIWLEQAPASLRAGVTLAQYRARERPDCESLGLNPAWNDDVLIATILQFRTEHPATDVVLVTQDTGPRLTAKEHGIRTFRLADDLRLPPESDPMQKENQELLRKLRQLEAASPQLEVNFVFKSGERSRYAKVRPTESPAFDGPAAEAQLASIRDKYPALQRAPSNFGPLIVPSEQEYERYNREREQYLALYSRYLREKWEVERLRRLTSELVVEIRNIGSKPAEDIDVYLHVPSGLKHREKGEVLAESEPPRPPTRPRTMDLLSEHTMAALARPMFDVASVSNRSGPPANVSRLSVREVDSYEIHAHIARIKHGDAARLPGIYLAFESVDAAQSFPVEYRLRAGNIPIELAGELHVVVDRTDSDTSADAI